MKKLTALFLALVLVAGALPAAAKNAAEEGTLDGGSAALYPAHLYEQNDYARRLRPLSLAEDKVGYIDEAGRLAIPAVFTEAEAFMECGYAIVSNQTGRYLMDATGKLVLALGKFNVTDVQLGNVILSDDRDRSGVVSFSGRVIVPFDAYSKLVFLEDGKLIYVATEDYLDYEETKQNPMGDRLMDSTGKDLYPNGRYTSIEYLGGNLAMFYTGDMSYGKGDASGHSGGVLVDLARGTTHQLPDAYQQRAIRVNPFAENGLARVAFTEFRKNSNAKSYYAFMDKTGKIVIADHEYINCTDFLSSGHYYTHTEEGRNLYVSMRNAKGAEVKKSATRGLELFANNKLIASTTGDGAALQSLFLTLDLNTVALPTGATSAITLGDYATFSVPGKNAEGGETYYYGAVDGTGRIVVPATEEGTLRLTGGYLARRLNSRDGLGYVEKYYDSTGALVFTKDSAQRFGNRVPVIQGDRTVYVPSATLGASIAPIAAGAAVSAKPSSTKLNVNGTVVALEAYEIAENNYIKIRDLAAILNGSDKQFEIDVDMAKNAINVTRTRPYTANGSELKPGDGTVKMANTGISPLFFDGEYVRLGVYNIANSNYYKLRDVMKLLDVSVGYDGATATATLTTATAYDRFEGGIATIYPVGGETLVWTVAPESKAAGAGVLLERDETAPNQSFAFQSTGGKYRITAMHSGKALTAKGAGTALTQADVGNDPAQLFTLQRKADGSYQVISSDGLYVTVAGAAAAGAQLVLSEKSDQPTQDFIVSQK